MAVSVHVTGVVPGCYRAGCPGSASAVARRPARRHREVGAAAGGGLRAGRVSGAARTRGGRAAGRRPEKARGKGAAAVRIRAIAVRIISAGNWRENSRDRAGNSLTGRGCRDSVVVYKGNRETG